MLLEDAEFAGERGTGWPLRSAGRCAAAVGQVGDDALGDELRFPDR